MSVVRAAGNRDHLADVDRRAAGRSRAVDLGGMRRTRDVEAEPTGNVGAPRRRRSGAGALRRDRPQPLERAQLVWLRAVTLSTPPAEQDRFVVMLDLLRTAHHGPSTMLHALAIGQAKERDTPDDTTTRDAVTLLARTIAWFGQRTEAGEVGAVVPPLP